MINYRDRFLDPFRFFWSYLGGSIILVFLLSFFAAAAEALSFSLFLPFLGRGPSGDPVEFGEKVLFFFSGVLKDYFYVDVSALNLIIAIFTLICVKSFLIFIAFFYTNILKRKLLLKLKSQLMDGVETSSLEWFQDSRSGSLVNVINEQSSLCIVYFSAMATSLSQAGLLVAYLTFAISYAPDFGAIAVLCAPVLLFCFRGLNSVVRSASRKTSEKNSEIASFVNQCLAGFLYLKVTGQFGTVKSHFNRALDQLGWQQLKLGLASAFTQSLREPVALFCLICALLILDIGDEFRLDSVLISILLFYRSITSALLLQEWLQKMHSAHGSVWSVARELERLKAGRMDEADFSSKNSFRGLALENLGYRYSGSSLDALADVTFGIPKGSVTAIVGSSGSGKTTLMKVLSGNLIPTAGSVLIEPDRIPVHRIRGWSEKIGFVPQDPFLFDGSIIENLSIGMDSTDPKTIEKCKSCIRRVGLEPLVESLLEGIDTRIGERGIKLSGGQKQRLAIARELIRDVDILLLDEPTSALDSESELAITDLLAREVEGVTIVIIAHRLSTIMFAQNVVVLEGGKVAQTGPASALLLEPEGRFHKLATLQGMC